MRSLILAASAALVLTGCAAFQSDSDETRLTAATKEWGTDVKLHPDHTLKVVYVEGPVGSELPPLEVRTGRTGDNRAYILVIPKKAGTP